MVVTMTVVSYIYILTPAERTETERCVLRRSRGKSLEMIISPANGGKGTMYMYNTTLHP